MPKQTSPQSPAAFDYLHTLLPHEIKSPSMAKILMVDKVKRVEIASGKELNVNKNLTESQMSSLLKLLQEIQQAFAWDYIDMKGLDPKMCTHRIYISLEYKPVRQAQKRINLALRDIVKIEL